MAISDANLAALNAAQVAYVKALVVVTENMVAGDDLMFTPANSGVEIGGTADNVDPGGLEEIVGTASTDGQVIGEFRLAHAVDKISDVTDVLLDGTSIGAANILDGTDAFTSGTQVKIETGGGRPENSGFMTWDSALGTEDITAVYTPSRSQSPTLQGQIVHAEEDETGAATGKGFATSPGNNIQARQRFRAVCGGGVWSSTIAA